MPDAAVPGRGGRTGSQGPFTCTSTRRLEAPTTRGFAAILHAGLDGLDADEVLATPPEFSSQLGLADLVSPLRLRGMAAMLSRIKRQVREHQAAQ